MSDDKSPVLESQGGAPTLRRKKNPFNLNLLWLLLCVLVATAWFTRSCSPSSLSIEERVQKILSQTPLIGMEIGENYSAWEIMTDGPKQTVMMTFPS